jgi:hypothetical protein
MKCEVLSMLFKEFFHKKFFILIAQLRQKGEGDIKKIIFAKKQRKTQN